MGGPAKPNVVRVITELEEQFAFIGYIAICWNYIEHKFDELMAEALSLADEYSIEITSRINGFEGKHAIIRKALEHSVKLPKATRTVIEETLAKVAECKTYRDSFVHTVPKDRQMIVGETKQ